MVRACLCEDDTACFRPCGYPRGVCHLEVGVMERGKVEVEEEQGYGPCIGQRCQEIAHVVM